MGREPASTPPQEGRPSGGHTVLQGRYVVHLDSPAGVCESETTHAFDARRADGGEPSLVALLCSPDLPLRLKAAARIKGRAIGGTLTLVDTGLARYPREIGRRYTLFVQKPTGRRVVARGVETWPPLSERDTVEHVVGPLRDALVGIHREGVAHGGVRPDNLYFSAGRPSSVILGESLSTPSGTLQPVAVETIQRGQAMPAARGEGGPAVDYYAMGATLALLLRGADPTRPMSAEEVVAAKIRDGSFRLLCSGLKVTPSMMQLLRGLLEDDGDLRWGPAQVEKWLSGTSVPTPSAAGWTKLPPLRFAEGQHDTPAAAAHAFAAHWRDAAKLIRSGAFGGWLRQRPEYRGTALDIQALVDRQGEARLSDEELTARTIFRVDPEGPIRFRGLAVAPDALGPGLAAVMAGGDRDGPEAFVDLLRSGLHIEYYDHRMRAATVPSRDRGTLRAQEINATRREPGLGLERSLYDLNPDLPCRSTLIGDQWVVSIEDILPALDRLAARQIPAGDPMDEHLAAFIANRLNLTTGNELAGLAAPSTRLHVRRLAIVALLALVHHRRGNPPVPNLSAWLAARLDPVVDRIKNRDRRRVLGERIAQAAKTGDVGRLLKIAADPTLLQADEAEFQAARRRYAATRQRIHFIAHDQGHRDRLVRSIGTRIATGMAVAILLLTTVAVILAEAS